MINMNKLVLFIPFVLILILSGCGKCDYIKQDEGKLIAQIEEEIDDIEFPVKYCPKHGMEMVYGKPKVTLRGYSRHSGKAGFSISCLYYCPCLSRFGRWVAPPYGEELGYMSLVTIDGSSWYLTIDDITSGNVVWR